MAITRAELDAIHSRFIDDRHRLSDAPRHLGIILDSREQQVWNSYTRTTRYELENDIIEILREQIEGPGEVTMLVAPDSPLHQNFCKVTAITDGARDHRLVRMENELLTDIDVLYHRDFAKRLSAERRIHYRLDQLYKKVGSKWYFIPDGLMRPVREIINLVAEHPDRRIRW